MTTTETNQATETVTSTSENTMSVVSPFDKLVVGLDLAVDVASLTTAATRLAERAEQLRNAAKQAEQDAKEAAEKAEAAKASPDRRASALAMAAALSAAGLTESAVRAALLAQYGKVKAPAAAKPTKPPSAVQGQKVTAGLPSAEVQATILDKVRAAGVDGIRLETLKERMPDTDPVALVATLKNALLDGTIRREGATRGMTYIMVS